MVSLLMQVDLDSRIPPELYQAVAELLAWLYRLESGLADKDAVKEAADTAASDMATHDATMPPAPDVPLLPH